MRAVLHRSDHGREAAAVLMCRSGSRRSSAGYTETGIIYSGEGSLGHHHDVKLVTLFLSFFPSHRLSRRFFSLSFLVVTQIRGHIAGSSPPSPLRLIFIARRFQLFLPSSTRVELCLPTLRALSSSVDPFFSFSSSIFANMFKISPRRDSNSRTNTSSIRGIPLDHRGDRVQYYFILLYTSK